MHSKRIQCLDFAKGLTIFFVVICHSIVTNPNLSFQNNLSLIAMGTVDTFIMPIFFSISGFLYHRVTSIRQFGILIYKKLTSLLIPYLFFSIFDVYLLESRPALADYCRIIWQPLSYLWFLYTLLLIFILVGGFDLLKIPPRVQLILALILAIFQTRITWWDGSNFSINPIASTLGYLIFFELGIFLNKDSVRKYLKSGFGSQFWGLILLFVILMIIQLKITGIGYNPDQVSVVDLSTKLLSVIIGFMIATNFWRNRCFNYFTYYGRYTLVIYLVHYPIVHFFHILLAGLSNNFILLETVLDLFFAWGLSIMFCRGLGHSGVLKFVFYPRHYVNLLLMKIFS